MSQTVPGAYTTVELYIYESPDGHLGDFRPYLDGIDNSFDEPLPLKPTDARWEKINGLYHPETGRALGGDLKHVGRAEIEWKELLRFPIVWTEEFEPV